MFRLKNSEGRFSAYVICCATVLAMHACGGGSGSSGSGSSSNNATSATNSNAATANPSSANPTNASAANTSSPVSTVGNAAGGSSSTTATNNAATSTPSNTTTAPPGGATTGATGATVTTATTGRGSIVSGASSSTTVTKAVIDTQANSEGFSALAGSALCDVKITSVRYRTVGGKNEATEATTALMLPIGNTPACSGSRPIVIYAHASSNDAGKDMTNTSGDTEAALVMATYAAQGYIVVAPNYSGYAGSSLAYHPFLNATAQAGDVIDALRAAKSVLSGLLITASSKLFIAGYSQGGYVAMATHREIQTNHSAEFTVTASAPMAGNYALEQTVSVLFNTASSSDTIFVSLLAQSYQNSYGLFQKNSDFYSSFYAQAPVLLPTSNVAVVTLLSANLFDQGDGSRFLVAETFRQDFINSASNSLVKASARNDLLDWKPSSAIGMCYGANDLEVPGFNTVRANAYFSSLNLAPGLVRVFDLEDASSVKPSLAQSFAAKKAAAGGQAAGQYHRQILPSYCNAISRDFFNTF